MSRVKENEKMFHEKLEDNDGFVFNNTESFYGEYQLYILLDISKSLAKIADEIEFQNAMYECSNKENLMNRDFYVAKAVSIEKDLEEGKREIEEFIAKLHKGEL